MQRRRKREGGLYSREQMVDNMIVSNIMHQMLASKPQPTIDCGGSAAQERPRLRLVFRNVGVRVVQVRDSDDPVVHPEIRHHVQ